MNSSTKMSVGKLSSRLIDDFDGCTVKDMELYVIEHSKEVNKFIAQIKELGYNPCVGNDDPYFKDSI